MDNVIIAKTRIEVVWDNFKQEHEVQIDKANKEEQRIKVRLEEQNKKKQKLTQACGDVDATDEDLVEINAGGKVITTKRAILTQLKGTRLESLFSGRWDKELQRDNNGRIFLDVNPVCFQLILDFLVERSMAVAEDSIQEPPSVDEEYKHIFEHQLELFGLTDVIPKMKTLDSSIIKKGSHVELLHNWLKEDTLDGDFQLLYRSSQDGQSNAAFHSKCDSKGCTLTIIQTTDGLVVGGYSNTPWDSVVPLDSFKAKAGVKQEMHFFSFSLGVISPLHRK